MTPKPTRQRRAEPFRPPSRMQAAPEPSAAFFMRPHRRRPPNPTSEIILSWRLPRAAFDKKVIASPLYKS